MIICNFHYKQMGNQYLITNDTGRYAVISADDFSRFTSMQLDPESDTWQYLEARLFCSRDPAEVFIRKLIQPTREMHSYLFYPTSLFIFAVTNLCNTRCRYCQAHGSASPCFMTKEIAKLAIQRIKAAPCKALTIEFQGGEPLLNFEVIKEIIETSEVELADRKLSFSLVSNLSLLTNEIAEYLGQHKVSVSTSLDGPKWIHDFNRPRADGRSAFDAMSQGLELLRKNGIQPGAIETTTRASLPYAKQIIDQYVDFGFSQVFLRPLTRLGSATDSWHEIGYTPEEYLRFYREGLDTVFSYTKQGVSMSEAHARMLLQKIIYGTTPNYMELRSPCGAAIGQVAITANGDVYTCDEGRMLAEKGDMLFRLGNVYQDSYSDWMNSSCCKSVCSASLLESLPGCSDCVYQPYCGVCPVLNYAINGSITSVCRDRCKIYQGMLDILFEYILESEDQMVSIMQNWGV